MIYKYIENTFLQDWKDINIDYIYFKTTQKDHLWEGIIAHVILKNAF